MRKHDEVMVWDPFVRLFHWILVAAFAVCYLTEGEPRWLHTNSGYVIAVLLVMRIIWGFVGTRYARFKDFVRGPREVLAHLRDVTSFRAKPYMGHDPAGGIMIVALILMLSLTVTSGMLLYGAKYKAGPFAEWTAGVGGNFLSFGQEAFASRDEDEWNHERREHSYGYGFPARGEKNEVLEEFHEISANVTLVLALIHTVGVLVVSLQTRENLPRAMITGRKKPLADY